MYRIGCDASGFFFSIFRVFRGLLLTSNIVTEGERVVKGEAWERKFFVERFQRRNQEDREAENGLSYRQDNPFQECGKRG